MPNKDLSTCLSRKNISGNNTQSPFLDWITRLKIATEVAESLYYLHHQCVPPLVHRDIQAGSILLDDKFEVRLGSLYKVCAEEKDIAPNTIARLGWGSNQGTPGTSNASYATCAYDVYSFGKVLLELVTRKQGFSATENSIMKDWMENVLAYIIPDKEELLVNIVESTLSSDKHLLSQVLAVSFIAKACLSPESSERPHMAHILLALDHIISARFGGENFKPIGHHGSESTALVIAKILQESEIVGRMPKATGNATLGSRTALKEGYQNGGSFVHPKLTIFSYSELMVATRGFRSDAVLREGEFSAITQAWLQDKSTSKSSSEALVAVRKFYSQNMLLLNDWQSRVCLLGRLSHPNLVEFLGYCLEDKELFVVHEYMQNGSLENHLFRTSSDVRPLSWDIRIKILIGAARGLAFLHAAEWQGYYEYFGTSDILLDGSYNAKISGIGTTKIVRRNVFNEVHPLWYERGKYFNAPPEYDLRKKYPNRAYECEGRCVWFWCGIG
ncbi:receptor like protein kinase S.2-like isoform X1 [Coffea eugenioides]|uniref:receptor like protein kinase S.2-like isoform X1 n=1 Tax=Coffea eugenioides TaxID=49369 RepID=UPI000F610360|nr:receptor like protein kinase S.2-like isoform X1 [Coffea eugenioides]